MTAQPLLDVQDLTVEFTTRRGIVKAVQKVYGLRKRPKPKRILKMGEAWRPYRSVASWYLWQTLRADFSPTAGDTRPRSR